MSSAATVYQTLNLVAITGAALAGSTAARRRGLDAVGVLSCAIITGLGGGLLRDVLLQDGIPASIANPWNPAAAFAAGAVLCFTSPRGAAWRVIAQVAEAATIGAWTVTGTEKAAALGIAPFSAILLGMLSSVGGGAIRDVVVLRRTADLWWQYPDRDLRRGKRRGHDRRLPSTASGGGAGRWHRHWRHSLPCRSLASLGTAAGRTPGGRGIGECFGRFRRIR